MKRQKGALVAAASLLISFSASAQLPHTFKNGEVADADQVNANFTYLENQIKKVASDNDAWITDHPHPYTHQPVTTNIGDQVTINGHPFVIVAMPFVDFADGSRHLLKYPVSSCENLSQQCPPPYFNTTSVSTSHVRTPFTSNLTVSGHPARFTPSEGRSYRVSNVYSHSTQQPERQLVIHHQVSLSGISIRVGETHVSFYAPINYTNDESFAAKYVQREALNTDDADFSDDIDWDAVKNHQPPFDAIYRYIDYIEVIDLPTP